MQLKVTFCLLTLTTLAILHGVSAELFLYWKYPWLDIPMHFLGGICVALGYSILPFFHIRIPAQYSTLITYVLVVFVVGCTWEFFEVVSGVAVIDQYFLRDTILDLLMDVSGGMLGYGILKRLETP